MGKAVAAMFTTQSFASRGLDSSRLRKPPCSGTGTSQIEIMIYYLVNNMVKYMVNIWLLIVNNMVNILLIMINIMVNNMVTIWLMMVNNNLVGGGYLPL